MSKSYKVIVIDATRKIIEEKTISSLADQQKIVGGRIETAHYLPDEDALFVNEEGLLGGVEDFFIYKGAHQPFAGNGVIVGTDEEGDSSDVKITLAEVKAMVKFLHITEIVEKIEKEEPFF